MIRLLFVLKKFEIRCFGQKNLSISTPFKGIQVVSAPKVDIVYLSPVNQVNSYLILN